MENYNPVQNSYATLWSEYKELKPSLMVVNVMRQILDYYIIQLYVVTLTTPCGRCCS